MENYLCMRMTAAGVEIGNVLPAERTVPERTDAPIKMSSLADGTSINQTKVAEQELAVAGDYTSRCQHRHRWPQPAASESGSRWQPARGNHSRWVNLLVKGGELKSR
ncbi:hypothetical protein F4W66_25270 (plasmid) [Escherichia coli]|nr:hypothetical protein F4W66_25270 [Escherichia coli]